MQKKKAQALMVLVTINARPSLNSSTYHRKQDRSPKLLADAPHS
jgi:hypothetical protein